MFHVHSPEAEAVHDLAESVVLVVELNAAHDVENHL